MSEEVKNENIQEDANTDLNQDGVVNRLINANSPREPETDKKETESSKKEINKESDESKAKAGAADADLETDDETDDDVGEQLITKEVAKVLNLPKSFIGKPLKEAGKSYDEAVKWENRNNKAIKQMESTILDLQKTLSTKDLKKIEADVTTELEDEETMPDPVSEPEEFSVWLKKRDDMMIAKILEEVGKVETNLKNNPSLKSAETIAAKEQTQGTLNAIQAALPEGVKAGEVLEIWMDENADDYEDMVKSGIYKNKPEKLVRDVLTYHKAHSFDSLKNMKESEIKKIIHAQTVKNLKAKGNKTKSDFTTNPRLEADAGDSGVVGRLLNNLDKQNNLKR